MANARLSFLCFLLLSLSLHGVNISAESPPYPSPSPSPSPSPDGSPSPSFDAPNPAPASSPLGSSPPAPSPLNPSPGSSPAPTPGDEVSINHSGIDERTEDSSGGMSGSKKAGIAIGVIVAVSVLMLAGMVYKKRQQNMRRAQYSYAVRRDIL